MTVFPSPNSVPRFPSSASCSLYPIPRSLKAPCTVLGPAPASIVTAAPLPGLTGFTTSRRGETGAGRPVMLAQIWSKSQVLAGLDE